MEKLQTLGWIVVGLLLFIWRMVQKARATTAQEQKERRLSTPDATGRPRPVAPGPPTTSFEELLRQMQSQNSGNPQPVPAALPVPRPRETTPAGRQLPREEASPARSLENEKRNARSLERQATTARSLEVPDREARLAASLPRAGVQRQEDYWSRQQARKGHEAERLPITDMLKNPEGVRAAFILGEILQRRF